MTGFTHDPHLTRGQHSGPGWREPVRAGLKDRGDERRAAAGFRSGAQIGGPASRLLLVDHAAADFVQHRIVLARALRDVGFDVHVAVPKEPGTEGITRSGFPIHAYHLRRKSIRPSDEVISCGSLFRLYSQLRPILVHHIGVKPALYGSIAAQLTGVPAVINLFTGLGHLFVTQSALMQTLRWVSEHALRFSLRHRNYRAILQNHDDRDYLVARGILQRDHALVIRGSGIDVSLFAPQPERDGVPIVLMASRLLWQKGVGEFVAAGQLLRERGIPVRFLLAGEPDPHHPSAVPVSTLERWSADGDVEWLGWRHDMPALIAQSHIVCLPSYYGEGAPRCLIEAAACGRPIITTDSPGCREIVRNGRSGLLVPVRDVESLAGAIARLVEDAPLRAAMGACGRALAVDEFSLTHVVNANLAVYRALLVPPDLGSPHGSVPCSAASRHGRHHTRVDRGCDAATSNVRDAFST